MCIQTYADQYRQLAKNYELLYLKSIIFSEDGTHNNCEKFKFWHRNTLRLYDIKIATKKLGTKNNDTTIKAYLRLKLILMRLFKNYDKSKILYLLNELNECPEYSFILFNINSVEVPILIDDNKKNAYSLKRYIKQITNKETLEILSTQKKIVTFTNEYTLNYSKNQEILNPENELNNTLFFKKFYNDDIYSINIIKPEDTIPNNVLYIKVFERYLHFYFDHEKKIAYALENIVKKINIERYKSEGRKYQVIYVEILKYGKKLIENVNQNVKICTLDFKKQYKFEKASKKKDILSINKPYNKLTNIKEDIIYHSNNNYQIIIIEKLGKEFKLFLDHNNETAYFLKKEIELININTLIKNLCEDHLCMRFSNQYKLQYNENKYAELEKSKELFNILDKNFNLLDEMFFLQCISDEKTYKIEVLKSDQDMEKHLENALFIQIGDKYQPFLFKSEKQTAYTMSVHINYDISYKKIFEYCHNNVNNKEKSIDLTNQG